MPNTSMRLRKLAIRLQTYWFALGIWEPVTVLRRHGYKIGIDRKGHLYLLGPEDSFGGQHNLYPGSSREEGLVAFDDAMSCSGCTEADFRAAIARVWSSKPLPVACYWLISCKLRGIVSKARRWLANRVQHAKADGVDLDALFRDS